MQKYIEKVSMEFLENIHTGYYHTPIMYFHNNIGVRWLFWERLNIISKFIQNNKYMNKSKCIDFGGGSGIFLPTLSKLFDEVILVDLEPSQAEIIIKEFNLTNCTVIKGNVFELKFTDIDCIIAADVIEHFDDTEAILSKLKTFMNKETFLITSLPTENWLYVLLRKIFRQEKPVDHYFSSYEIEQIFIDNGLINNTNFKSIPLIKPFDLFSIVEWKLEN